MNKILVSGLGIGKEVGVCDCCNMNYGLLMSNTSTLLMADKICVPKNSCYGKNENESRAIKLMLEKLSEEHMLEEFDVSEMYTDRFRENIISQSGSDLDTVKQSHEDVITECTTEDIKKEVENGASYFCTPMVASINASLVLAEDLSAQCLFNQHESEYLEYRYGDFSRKLSVRDKNEVFKSVFSTIVPNMNIVPNYIKGYNCDECDKNKSCNDSYLSELEKNLDEIFNIRRCDEMRQIRSVINRIIDEKDSLLGLDDSASILEDFRKEQKAIQENIRLKFPAVKRFLNIVTMVSIPFIVGGSVINQDPGLMIKAPVVIEGAVKILDQGIKYYESKNAWVNFLEKQAIIEK